MLTGDDGDNVLASGAGNDQLDGGAGADRLRGGAGDDLYRVDNLGDLVEEDFDAGFDTVVSSVSYHIARQCRAVGVGRDARAGRHG